MLFSEAFEVGSLVPERSLFRYRALLNFAWQPFSLKLENPSPIRYPRILIFPARWGCRLLLTEITILLVFAFGLCSSIVTAFGLCSSTTADMAPNQEDVVARDEVVADGEDDRSTIESKEDAALLVSRCRI